MKGNKFWRDASGRLNFGMFKSPAETYFAVCDAIVARFHLAPHGGMVAGGEVVFQDFCHEEQIIGLEWDIWMGFMVVAKSKTSEGLVRSIGFWLLQNQTSN
jgi:hypothetical protein